MDHSGDDSLVMTNISPDYADEVNNNKCIDRILKHRVELPRRVLIFPKPGNIFECKYQACQTHRDEDRVK